MSNSPKEQYGLLEEDGFTIKPDSFLVYHCCNREDPSNFEQSRKTRLYTIAGVFAFLTITAVTFIVIIAVASSGDAEADIDENTKYVVLVSLDGFRADYLARFPNQSATLTKLAVGGVSAVMRPVFPTKTFPNHYSIVTGLYPESHGIVSNTIYDPVFNATFTINNEAAVSDGRWWGGEPVWATAVRQGLVSAAYFWPGSEAEINGYRPTYYYPYNGSVPYSDRVDQVLAWLDMPAETRPRFICVYFDAVDTYGHTYGPSDSDMIGYAISLVDDAVAQLVQGLADRGMEDMVNLMVVADHGMAQIDQSQVIFLDDYINVTQTVFIDYSPIVAILPNSGLEQQMYTSLLGAHPNMTVYYKDDLPDRYHYVNNIRIQPIIAVTDEGYSVTTRGYYSGHTSYFVGGNHGYDNKYASMQAIFIANGPSFPEGQVLDSFLNIEIYDLLCDILDISAAPNNGTGYLLQELDTVQ